MKETIYSMHSHKPSIKKTRNKMNKEQGMEEEKEEENERARWNNMSLSKPTDTF